jgi:hypothetical protein
MKFAQAENLFTFDAMGPFGPGIINSFVQVPVESFCMGCAIISHPLKSPARKTSFAILFGNENLAFRFF